MEFEAISATRMVALMVAGGVFSLAGLYMMLRPRPEGAAKVELFGLKFESSSVGLLVFIVGAGFLSVPLFVPEVAPEEAPPARAAPAQPSLLPQPSGDTQTAVTPPTPAPASPALGAALIKEIEPNNSFRDALQLAPGQVAEGKFAKDGDQDWYEVNFGASSSTGYEVKLRHVLGSTITANVFDAREVKLGRMATGSGVEYFSLEEHPTPKVLIQIGNGSHSAFWRNYEISVEPRQ